MCKRRCIYRGAAQDCCYHLVEGKSRLAQIYRETGVKSLTDEVKRRVESKNCCFYVPGKSLVKPKPTTLPGSRQRPKKMDAHEAEARRLYDAGWNDEEIAAKLGVSRTGVQNWRKRNGLAARVHKNRLSFDPAEALLHYESGESDAEIGKAMGVTAYSIWKWRKRKGLPPKHEQRHGKR